MKIQLKTVRLAFPQLFEPKTVNGEGEPAYSATFLLPPNHPQVKEIRAAVEKIGKDKFGAKWESAKKECERKDALVLHDGDVKDQYDGFAGNLYISARSKTRPLVIDRDKTPLDSRDGKPYGGCYVDAVITLWAQDNKFGKRINASLGGVRFIKDGDAFGSAPASEEDFDDIPEEEEALV